MAGLEIILKEIEKQSPTDICQIGIRANDRFLTRLFRYSSNREGTFLHAPPACLAFWILDNWWKIFHEPELPGGVTAEWLLAHEMSAIGGGYAWPAARFWGERRQVGIRVQPLCSDSSGPVRFKADCSCSIPSVDVERAFDAFLDRVCELALDDRDTLRDLHLQVKREREDPEVAAWRAIEAKLGFDVDEAPVELMRRLNGLIAELGLDAVSEACMSKQGHDVSLALEEGLSAVENSRTRVDLSAAVSATPSQVDADLSCAPSPSVRTAPWAVAERAATRMRELGDAIWSEHDSLGLISPAESVRQKFQRAFAQSFLCPFRDLLDYIGTDSPTSDDVTAAAHRFRVSERMVRSMLVNKKVIDRQEFQQLIAAEEFTSDSHGYAYA